MTPCRRIERRRARADTTRVTQTSAEMPVSRIGSAPVVSAAALVALTVGLFAASSAALGQFPAFLPAFLAIVFACDALTALLLVTQYLAGASTRLLVLAAAYLWSASVIVPHALVFSGLVTPTGLLGATPSSAPWLWTAWHVGLPVLIGVALAPWPAGLQRRLDAAGAPARRVAVAAVAAVVLLGVALVVLAVTRWAEHVPVIIVEGDYRVLTERFGPWIAGANLLALVAGTTGVLRRRDRSGLEAWALVAVVACTGDVALTLWAGARFTTGWYGARVLALVAALVVLTSMIREITVLYRRVRRHAERVQAHNAELVAANALRDGLVAVVSHELRSPLTAIEGYLELVTDPDVQLAPEQAANMLARCSVLTRRLTLISEDLLAVAAIDHGTLSVSPRVLDAAEQLRECAAGFPDLDVRVDAEDGLLLHADPLRLQQVVANLVRNAQKYGAAPVEVSAARTLADEVEVRVHDAGDGVPAAFVAQLFERFTRADTADRAAGAGLGLSIVRELVEAHGGSVRYEAEANTFVVALPAASAPAQRPQAEGSREVTAAAAP